MRLKYIHICDNAFGSEGGKFNIIGIFQNINILKFPGGIPKFHIAGELELPKQFKGPLKLELSSKKSKKVKNFKIIQMTTDVPKTQPKTNLNLGFNFEMRNLIFKEPGEFIFEITANGTMVGNVKVNVRQRKAGDKK